MNSNNNTVPMSYDQIKIHIRQLLKTLSKAVFMAEDFQVGDCKNESIGLIQSVANEMVADGELEFTPLLKLRRSTATMNINEIVVSKLLRTVDAGLVEGLGSPIPGQMCVEAAVCYALGQEFGDEPTCVSNIIREFTIALNDVQWSSDKARAAGMRKLAVAQLGSAGVVDDVNFTLLIAKKVIHHIIPIFLREANFNVEADRCEKEGTIEAVRAIHSVLIKTGWTSEAINEAWHATHSVVDFFDWLYREKSMSLSLKSVPEYIRYLLIDNACFKNSDKIFLIYAELTVETLIELKSPGCKWLYLTQDIENNLFDK